MARQEDIISRSSISRSPNFSLSSFSLLSRGLCRRVTSCEFGERERSPGRALSRYSVRLSNVNTSEATATDDEEALCDPSKLDRTASNPKRRSGSNARISPGAPLRPLRKIPESLECLAEALSGNCCQKRRALSLVPVRRFHRPVGSYISKPAAAKNAHVGARSEEAKTRSHTTNLPA